MTDNTTDNVSLNLDDVETAIWAIDLAADQGAFKGWEDISKAFSVRERMVRFLNAAHQNQKAAVLAAAQAAALDDPTATDAPPAGAALTSGETA